MMLFDQFQEFTHSKARYNENVWLHKVHRESVPSEIVSMTCMYPVLALAEEAGEVAGKVAKFIRKSQQGADVEQLKQDIKKELGDALFQISETARQFGFTLSEIAVANVDKLDDREARGVLIGVGDDR